MFSVFHALFFNAHMLYYLYITLMERSIEMTRTEINTFIETMEEIGDIWTPEQVEDVYGDKTLDEALIDRKSACDKLGDIISTIIHQ